MTKDIEREAFEATQNTKVLFERIEYIESNDVYLPKNGFENSLIVSSLAERLNFGWSSWQAAKAHEAKKLEGCVVVPVEPTYAMYQAYEKHSVAPMSTLSKTGYKAMLEAARGGNENI